MNKLVLALAVALFGTMAMGQTCTPVTVSETPTKNADGKGPAATFYVDGYPYSSGNSTYTRSTPSLSQTVFGYVDIYGLYGGCLQRTWYASETNQLRVTDLNTGEWVYDHIFSAGDQTCVNTASCYFSMPSSISPTLTLQVGHKYMFDSWMYGVAVNIGQSPTYHTWIELIIQ